MEGQPIAGYMVTDFLGHSGSGELFKAEDQRLGRTVVLKILSDSWKERPQAHQRFLREAKAASRLDHPNICSIFEIGQTEDGKPFSVMPFYGGRNLTDILEAGPIPRDQAVDWIEQIADGLAKAHGADIVHRDIRPENLLITAGGKVKILDFGLAEDGDDLSRSASPTALRYRAPEQRAGRPSTPATDQWALAELARAMLAPMASNDPICSVLQRAQASVPEDRYAGIDVLAQRIADALALEDATSTGVSTALDTRRRLWLGVVGLVLLAGLLTWLARTVSPPAESLDLKLGQSRPQTRDPGLEKNPGWSPNGDLLVYAGDSSGQMDIWLLDLRSGESSNLTAEHRGYDDHPVFSPDGRHIAFVSDRNGGGIFRIPSRGGEAELLIAHPMSAAHDSKVRAPTLAFSPDGRQLIYSGTRTAPGLFVADADGRNSRRLELKGLDQPFSLSEPALSPDGRRLAFTELLGTATSTSKIWTVNPDGTALEQLTTYDSFNHHPRWSADGRQIFFISDRGGHRDLWLMELDDLGRAQPPARPVTVGISIGSFDVSADGRQLSYSKVSERSNIWSLTIDDQPRHIADALALTAENHFVEFIDISQDGLWITFDSNRLGNVDIWRLRLLDGELRQLTRDPAHDWRPRFSPDGRWVAFYSLRSGHRNLWIVPSAGGPARRLTERADTDWMPSWSPDSSLIAYESSQEGRRSVWLVPTGPALSEPSSPDSSPALAKARRISPELDDNPGYDAMYPVFSPDGQALAYSLEGPSGMGLFIQGLDQAQPQPVTETDWEGLFALQWTAEGYLYAHGHRRPSDRESYWQIDVETGSARPLIRMESASLELMEGFAVYGRTLFFPLWERQGDIWSAQLQSRSDGPTIP